MWTPQSSSMLVSFVDRGMMQIAYVLLCVCLFALFLSTWYKTQSSGNQETQLRKCPYWSDPQVSLWGIFLNNDWFGRAQPTLASAIPEQLFLGHLKKQAEQGKGMKQLRSLPLGFYFNTCFVIAVWILDLTSDHGGLYTVNCNKSPPLQVA